MKKLTYFLCGISVCFIFVIFVCIAIALMDGIHVPSVSSVVFDVHSFIIDHHKLHAKKKP